MARAKILLMEIFAQTDREENALSGNLVDSLGF